MLVYSKLSAFWHILQNKIRRKYLFCVDGSDVPIFQPAAIVFLPSLYTFYHLLSSCFCCLEMMRILSIDADFMGGSSEKLILTINSSLFIGYMGGTLRFMDASSLVIPFW